MEEIQLRDKISKLKEAVVNNSVFNMLKDYPLYRLTETEALKLYESDKDVGISKSVLYFLLSNEDKRKYIKDIETFDYFFEGCTYLVKDLELRNEIVEKMIDMDYINLSNKSKYITMYNTTSFSGEVKYKLYSKCIEEEYSESLLIDIEMYFSQKHRVELYKKIINSCYLPTGNRLLSSINKYVANEESYIELICMMITEDYFAFDRYEALSNCTKVIDKLSSKGLEKLFDFISIHKDQLNENISYVWLMSKLTVDQIINHFNKFGIDVDIDELCTAIAQNNYYGSEDTLINIGKLYNYLLTLKDSKKYITPNVLINFLTGAEGEQKLILFFDYVLKNQNLTVDDKIAVLSASFANEERLKAIDLMISKLGNEAVEDKVVFLIREINLNDNLEKYPYLKKLLIEKFKIENIYNFNSFLKRFRVCDLEYLETNNVINLINNNEFVFNRILKLFNHENTQLNMGVVNTMTNVFLQRMFRITCNEDYNVFARVESLLQDKNEYTQKEILKIFKQIEETLDIEKILDGENLDIDDLFAKDKRSIELLHKITDAYIAKKREEYVINNMGTAMNVLGLDKYYTKSYIKKQYILLNPDFIIKAEFNLGINYADYNEAEIALSENTEILDKIIEYKKRGGGKPPIEIVPYLRTFDDILDKLYDKKQLTLENDPEDVKYDYFIPKLDEDNVLSILSEIKDDEIKDKILRDEKLYNKLNALFSKYKIIGWGNVFNQLAANADIDVDCSVIGALINYFDRIDLMLEQMPKKNRNFTSMLDLAGAYCSDSKKYSILIGKENFRYIVTNPGPNKSALSRHVRVSEIDKHVKNMYERTGITVPCINKTIEINEDKSVRCVLGDVYNPMLLTYGERTGSCLRIKGAFDDLFAYCLKDKNGFHIRFENPETGEFISRVSGIRNGNTVFLNELRFSVNPEYDSGDLVNVINKIAEYLVESTRDCEHPIDNVIISNDMAMKDETIDNLKIRNLKIAFNNNNFNITNNGHVLYTSSEDHKKLVEYKFDENYVDEYKPLNIYVGTAKDEKACEIIKRVHMINELLKGQTIEQIDLTDMKDVKKCIYGDGWVVYMKHDSSIQELIIDRFKNDADLRKLIDDSKKKYFGGQINENKRKNS